MMKRPDKAILFTTLAAMLLLPSPASAEEVSSRDISWYALGSGGGPTGSDTYALNVTVGQPIVRSGASPSYRVTTGYWAGVPVEHHVYLPVVLRSQ